MTDYVMRYVVPNTEMRTIMMFGSEDHNTLKGQIARMFDRQMGEKLVEFTKQGLQVVDYKDEIWRTPNPEEAIDRYEFRRTFRVMKMGQRFADYHPLDYPDFKRPCKNCGSSLRSSDEDRFHPGTCPNCGAPK